MGDLAETKKAIIAASSLPLSIIIIGVGSEDFEAMEELDSDDRLLRQDNMVAARDIVQFVELRKFIQSNGTWSKDQLAKEVLAEVPAQLLSFMKMKQFPATYNCQFCSCSIHLTFLSTNLLS